MSNAQISRGAKIGGDVNLGDGVVIESGCSLSGSVDIQHSAKLYRGTVVSGDVSLGPRANVKEDVELIGDIKVGGYGAIARRCLFQSDNHFTNRPGLQFRFYDEVIEDPLWHTSKGAITVGNDVWLGANVIVLSGVDIGDGAIVGAGSVVTKDVEPYAIVAGNPAEHRGWRFDEATREQLLDVEWWNWSEEQIRANERFFTTDLDAVDNLKELIV